MKKNSISNLFDSSSINNTEQIVGGLNYTAAGDDTTGTAEYDIVVTSYDASGNCLGNDTEGSGTGTKDKPVLPR